MIKPRNGTKHLQKAARSESSAFCKGQSLVQPWLLCQTSEAVFAYQLKSLRTSVHLWSWPDVRPAESAAVLAQFTPQRPGFATLKNRWPEYLLRNSPDGLFMCRTQWSRDRFLHTGWSPAKISGQSERLLASRCRRRGERGVSGWGLWERKNGIRNYASNFLASCVVRLFLFYGVCFLIIYSSFLSDRNRISDLIISRSMRYPRCQITSIESRLIFLNLVDKWLLNSAARPCLFLSPLKWSRGVKFFLKIGLFNKTEFWVVQDTFFN